MKFLLPLLASVFLCCSAVASTVVNPPAPPTPISVPNGGSGLATSVLGDVHYGSGVNTTAALPGNITSTNKFFAQTGTGSVSAAPSWQTIISGDLTSALTTPPPIGTVTPGIVTATVINTPSVQATGAGASADLSLVPKANGQVIFGSGAWAYATAASGKASILLNNGSNDSPNVKFAYADNANLAMDTAASGSFGGLSSQFVRFIKNSDETGGAVEGGWDAAGNFAMKGTGYFTGTFTPASGTVGSATNDSAATGIVGEFQQAQVTSGSAISLTTATAATITSKSLTAGDWNCWGVVDYVTTGATTSDFKSGISTTAATFGAQDTFQNMPLISTALSDTFGQSIAEVRLSLASTTTAYLIGQANFSIGTSTGYGTLNCRRMR